jgi:hypothetical protein
MSSFISRSAVQRDDTFPLRRANRYYTPDLRFMAMRLFRYRRTVAVYEFAGIDHNEHQLWILLGRARSWVGAVGTVNEQRVRPPVSSEAPTEMVLDLRETLAEPSRVRR